VPLYQRCRALTVALAGLSCSIAYNECAYVSVCVCMSVPAYFKFRVQGEGIMSSIYRGLVAIFDPISKSDVLASFAECVPRPRQPNYYMYRVIGLCLSASLFVCLSVCMSGHIPRGIHDLHCMFSVSDQLAIPQRICPDKILAISSLNHGSIPMIFSNPPIARSGFESCLPQAVV